MPHPAAPASRRLRSSTAARGAAPAVLALALAAGCARGGPPLPAEVEAPCLAAVDAEASPVGAVTWLAPANAAERGALNRWCQTVGPALVHVPPGQPTRAIDRLAIVSWNVHVGAGDLHQLIDDVRRGRFTGGAPVHDVVVLAQEAHRTSPLVPADLRPGLPVPARIAAATPPADVLAAAQSLGLHLFYAPSMRNGLSPPGHPAGDRGNAILSTAPLAELTAIELPLERQRRVAITATVGGTSSSGRRWRLRLVNVHLENRAGRRGAWLRAAAARERQTEALLATLDHEEPLLLAGDLNAWGGRTEPALRALGRAFDPWPHEDRRPTFARGDLRLDFMFKRRLGGAAVWYSRLDDPYGSDHLPLLALVDWP